jgi:uncharacterized membrane protein YphA (DoxX/SURF4 family)
MMTSLTQTRTLERAMAVFVPRAILGLMYLYAGGAKILGAGVQAYAQQSLAFTAMSAVVPAGVLMPIATITPFIEVVLGALILIGLWTRPALRALAVVIIIAGLGYGVLGLLHPMGATAMDTGVVNTYLLPRAALLAVVLFLPRTDDLLSLDALLGLRE